MLLNSTTITGFFRDGFCNTNEYDQGLHIVCCLIDDNFLKFSLLFLQHQGNAYLITAKTNVNLILMVT